MAGPATRISGMDGAPLVTSPEASIRSGAGRKANFMADRKRTHEIRDPIHIFIKVDNRERKVIASRPFQRPAISINWR